MYLKNQLREFRPLLVTDVHVFAFIDVLISFWDQKVNGQGHSRQWLEKPDEYNIFVCISANFTKIRSLCTWACDRLTIGQKAKVKVTAGNDPKPGKYNIFENIW